ncbi:MAG: hypothetical protein HYX78_15440 [Armatimonadetes bacterium]|nr:hypothetical protein [Armatimonadota bacterium]
MQTAIRIRTVVQPGGKVEVTSPDLTAGETVEVIVLGSEIVSPKRRPALDILAEAPGHRLFKSAEEVNAYVREERNSWDR